MPHPAITVIIPAWNAADHLPATLASVRAQTWPEVEIVVVDDGSTDGTADLLAAAGPGVRWTRIEASGGPSRPRNVAIGLARGEYVAIFDSDDLMEPHKLARAAAVLGDHPDVDLVFSNFRSIDGEGRILNPDYLAEYRNFRADLEPTGRPDVFLLDGRRAYSRLCRANFIGTSSVVVRRSVLDRVGPFDESMKNADDVEMWRRIAWSGGKLAFIDEVLHSYRRRADGVTGRGVGRYPAIISGLERQFALDLEPDDRRVLAGNLREVRFQYAEGLGRLGRIAEAWGQYRILAGGGMNRRWVTGVIRLAARPLLRR